ncbi:hypothetical protein ABZ805_19130 [Saccharopolyspora sp. NPDC047091]|uniref:hypothetical protein n=1 Tax=Saccharopolyspora sp. NPDC047091 TaxID=3155924 RepID=UPI0033D3EA84
MSEIGGILLWLLRTGTGLHLDVLHSDTGQAHRARAELTGAVRAALRGFRDA